MLELPHPAPTADILIVDDTPQNLSLLFAILDGSGYQVRAASNGELALQAARSATPDLVLLDIVMPDLDGYAVCAQLKADPRTADVPIIFLSALSDTRAAVPNLTAQPLPSAAEAHLLRIVQEALNNVRKHAAAAHVQVMVAVDSEDLRVTVRDDGRGFAPPPSGANGGARYGLRSIRERAVEIGAELQIDSAPGVGTTISLRVPLRMAELPRGQTILRVDDHPLFVEGLRNLLAARGLNVVGTARDGRDAVEQVHALRPDVVLMDMEMPHMDGLAALRQIVADLPDTRVVMLTAVDDERVLEAVRAGAAGYLRKDQRAEEFFEALAALARGEAPLAPGLAARMMREISRQEPPALLPPAGSPALNTRQQEVLALLARGMTYKAIGAELAISEHTVRYHVQEIMTRLNLASRAELLAYATQRR